MLKRFSDIATIFIFLPVILPVFIIIYLLVYLKLGTPVFYTQLRPGLNSIPFKMFKFRTMLDVYNCEGELLDDTKRLTRFGKWLRASSLDEIPELWNVIKGDMSLVGPRPLLVEYLEHYSSKQQRRHEVLPGITGWAQINGRNELSWEEKFEMDVWYVDNQSFWLDLKILARTMKKVLTKSGVSPKDQEIMPRFDRK